MDDRYHVYEIAVLLLTALLLLLAVLELIGFFGDDRFAETPENEPAVQVDSVWTPPTPIARTP